MISIEPCFTGRDARRRAPTRPADARKHCPSSSGRVGDAPFWRQGGGRRWVLIEQCLTRDATLRRARRKRASCGGRDSFGFSCRRSGVGAASAAGRRLIAAWPSPPHRPRARHQRGWPVTLRARDALPSLRSAPVFPVLQLSLAASHEPAFRVVHFSVQSDHVHLIAEGDEADALVRGLQGLAARCAKAINRAAGRRGSVWWSRYHSHALRTPTEARRGLVYVLLNFRKHLRARPGIDPRSSGPWFGGWRRARHGRASRPDPSFAGPVAPPRTWLAAVGWRRAGGGIALDETRGPARRSERSREPRPSDSKAV